MSKIEDIYDKLNAVVAATLPSYTRFPNPYAIDANTFLHLRQGFAVSVGPGADTERYLGCLITWQRDFTVTLVRQVMATQNDLPNRESLEKEILDDHDLLRKAIYNNSNLDQNAIKTTLVSDSGLQFLDGDRLKFLAIEMTINVEYEEQP